jgi:hypothetical protein
MTAFMAYRESINTPLRRESPKTDDDGINLVVFVRFCRISPV